MVSQTMSTDHKYMLMALQEAYKAYTLGEVPIGCVIVVGDKVISKAHNLRHTKKCSTYHAEILAIEKACKKLGRWILDDATIYVTLEPCIMCAGAIVQSRFKRLVFGVEQKRYGCVSSLMRLFDDFQFNHKVIVDKGHCIEEIENLLSKFFMELREKGDFKCCIQNNIAKKD